MEHKIIINKNNKIVLRKGLVKVENENEEDVSEHFTLEEMIDLKLNENEKEYYFDSTDNTIKFLNKEDCFLIDNFRTLNNVIDGEFELDYLKSEMYNQIDQKTDKLTYVDLFEYNGYYFKTESQDLINWMALLLMKDSLTFPFTTRANEEMFIFQSVNDLLNFAGILFTRVHTLFSQGWTLKDQILNCNSLEELKLIEDNR